MKGARWLPLLAALPVLVAVMGSPLRLVPGREWLDAYGTWWFYWFAEQILRGADPSHTELLFFPWGKDIFLHTGGNLLDAFAALPMRLILGPTLGYNTFVATILVFDAWATARLARTYGLGELGAGLAGLLLAWSPFVLGEIEDGRPTQALVAFLPLGLALLREGRGAWAGVALAAAGWTYWYFGLMAGFAATLLVLGERRWREGLLGALVCGALVAPAAWPMLQRLDEVPGLLALDGGPYAGAWPRTVEGDAQAIFGLTLDGRRFTYGVMGRELGARLIAPTTLLLALFGRPRRGWILAGVAMLVACGPELWPEGPANPLWWALVELPIFRRWWWPERAAALATLPLAILAASAVEGWWGSRKAVLGVLAAGTLVWAPFPLSSREAGPSPSLACLREAPPGAVIDLPLAWDQGHLVDQVGHEKPQLGGMLSKKAAFGGGAVDALRKENAFLARLADLGDRQFVSRRAEPVPEGREALRALGYRYVVVRRAPYAIGGRDQFPRLQRQLDELLGPPAFVDAAGGPWAVAFWDLDGQLRCQEGS